MSDLERELLLNLHFKEDCLIALMARKCVAFSTHNCIRKGHPLAKPQNDNVDGSTQFGPLGLIMNSQIRHLNTFLYIKKMCVNADNKASSAFNRVIIIIICSPGYSPIQICHPYRIIKSPEICNTTVISNTMHTLRSDCISNGILNNPVYLTLSYSVLAPHSFISLMTQEYRQKNVGSSAVLCHWLRCYTAPLPH